MWKCDDLKPITIIGTIHEFKKILVMHLFHKWSWETATHYKYKIAKQEVAFETRSQMLSSWYVHGWCFLKTLSRRKNWDNTPTDKQISHPKKWLGLLWNEKSRNTYNKLSLYTLSPKVSTWLLMMRTKSF